jgi:hypothetical protein
MEIQSAAASTIRYGFDVVSPSLPFNKQDLPQK